MSRTTRRIFIAALIAAGALVLMFAASCGEPANKAPKMKDVQLDEERAPANKPAVPTAAKPAPSGTEQPSAVTPEDAENVLKKKTEEFVYDPINKPDPFKSVTQEQTSQPGDEGRPNFFEIRFYKLVGIVWGTSKPLAIFEDPSGRAFTLKTGDRVGKEEGVLSQIKPDRVVITRESLNFEGKKELKELEILLHPEAEKKGLLGGGQ